MDCLNKMGPCQCFMLWHGSTYWWYPTSVRCHRLLTSLVCRIYLTGHWEQQTAGRRGTVHVCVGSAAVWPYYDLEGRSGGFIKTMMHATLPLTHTPTVLHFMCYYGARSFIRANLCCWETLGPIQHRRNPFKHHPTVSWIPFSFEKGSWVFKM